MTIDTRIHELAPDPAYSAEQVALIRARVLDRATAFDNSPRHRPLRRPRRRLLVGVALAMTVAGALTLGPVLDSGPGPFAANALTPLAQAAQRTEVPPLSNGRVLHRVTEHRMAEDATGKVITMRQEEWTLGDGTFYRRTTVDGAEAGPVEFSGPPASDDLTPGEIAALPTEPAGLLKAVKDSPQAAQCGEGCSGEQALLGTIIYRGYAPTKVWAAAIEAYGSFDDVQVRVDEAKHLTYVTEIAKGGPLTMRFDSATGRLLGYDSTSPQDGGRTDTMRVLVSKVEDGVPARIVADAQQPE